MSATLKNSQNSYQFIHKICLATSQVGSAESGQTELFQWQILNEIFKGNGNSLGGCKEGYVELIGI